MSAHLNIQDPQGAGSFLSDTPLFKDCGAAFFEEIERGAAIHTHSKGKLLFLHGDEAQSFFLIKSGWVKLFRETLDGTQAVIDILPAGYIFGETAIFDRDISPYSAEIVEAAEIIAYPLRILKSEIESNNALALNMLSSMARYRREQDREIEHREIQNAPQRIGCFLLRLAPQNQTGAVKIHLPYDKTLVASRLGMQPETFSRALGKLKQQTGIKIHGATIELDSLDQLSSFSCAACSSEFPCKDLENKNY
ncbi:MAG: Crp/Fnr family transcriptional regulator [Bdellovibrionales bacterium]